MMPSDTDELPLSKIDADKEALDHGLHTRMAYLELVSARLEKYVEFAIAIRNWANTTTGAAAQALDLLKMVDEE